MGTSVYLSLIHISFFGGTKERNPDCCSWVCRKPKGAKEWTAPKLAADGVFSLKDSQAALAGIDLSLIHI